MSKSEIWPSYCTTIWLIPNLKHYLFFIEEHLQATSSMPCPTRVSWNSCLVFFRPDTLHAHQGFGRCMGINSSTVQWFQYATTWEGNSTRCLMDLPRTQGEGTMGWVPWSQLQLLCNEIGDVLMFCLTPANEGDRNPRVWKVFTEVLYGKSFCRQGVHQARILWTSSTKASTSFLDPVEHENKIMPLVGSRWVRAI